MAQAGQGAPLVQGADRGPSTIPTRRSTSGSPTASSTRRTTAWTVTSRRATATGSRSTGAARRARSATSPTPTCTREVQQFANALKDLGDREGRHRRDLPADDPRGRRRDARVRADRRAAQRRVRRLLADSVKERMEFSEAKALITVDGARRKGKTAPIKEQVDKVMKGLDTLEHIVVVKHTDDRVRDAGRARRLVPRDHGQGRRRVPGRGARRRAPAVRALHERLDRQAQGRAAHHRRLPDRRHGDPPVRVRPQARGGRVLVRGRRRLGHRPLLHRLRAAVQRRHERDVGGRARLPGTRASGGRSPSATA